MEPSIWDRVNARRSLKGSLIGFVPFLLIVGSAYVLTDSELAVRSDHGQLCATDQSDQADQAGAEIDELGHLVIRRLELVHDVTRLWVDGGHDAVGENDARVIFE